MTQEEKIRHKIGEIVAAHSLGVLFASQSNKVKELQEEDQKTMFFIYDLFTSELNRKMEEHDRRVYKKCRKLKLEASKDLGFAVIDTLMLKVIQAEDRKSLLNEKNESNENSK